MGKPIRFWATADNPAKWDFLIELGVDFINTDQPMELRRYLDGKFSALQTD